LFTTTAGNINLSTGQSPTGTLATASNITYTPGEWVRIDLLYYRVTSEPANGIGEIRLFVNGVKAVLIAGGGTEVRVSIDNGNMRSNLSLGSVQNYGDRTAVWSRDQTISFKRIAE